MKRIYCCIDLKSFYASCECVERKLDPLNTNLVVADKSRTEKTICLAVTPSLKKYGLSGRSRLFEVVSKVNEINNIRKRNIHFSNFSGSSFFESELDKNKYLKLDYIVATPRMGLYMEYSTKIYQIYLKYLSPDDIFPYSVDEVFCDITEYLKTAKKTPREFVTMMIKEVYKNTGITATGGIGTNMYLAKIAMDIEAKHVGMDKNGVRIAVLDEMSYRKKLWNHKPISDFWRVGKGYAKKLEENNIYTMGDVARCAVKNEDLLYNLFGVNAELLIDHSFGYEPCTLKDVKEYKPEANSISSGQVLHCPYNYIQTKLIVKEMTDLLVLDLVEKYLVSSQFVLDIGYDIENVLNGRYHGEISEDRYGRKIPKHAHGTINLEEKSSSTKEIIEAVMKLYEKIIDKNLLVRRINITANNVTNINDYEYEKNKEEQLSFFVDYAKKEKERKIKKEKLEKENSLQHAIIDLKKKYGKNAILKGMNLQKDGTTIARNSQIGGHSK